MSPSTKRMRLCSRLQWPRRIPLLKNDGYELLPRPGRRGADDGEDPNHRYCCGVSIISPRSIIIITLAAAITFFVVVYEFASCLSAHRWHTAPNRPPPLFEAYRARERLLPQHNFSLPHPEGAHAKFLWVANHGSNFGWGNYMQEMIINAYLAYAADRAYVFDNYTWAREGPEVSRWYNGNLIPSRIPLSAIISGPMIGGPMSNPDVPRAVSREYFLSVCPESERAVLDTRITADAFDKEGPSVGEIVQTWVAKLKAVKSPCVELAQNSPALFSYNITNTRSVDDIFPLLSQSPILADFGWSPLVLSEFYANLRYFGSGADIHSPSPIETSTAPLKGLLALHVRRGDYTWWCAEAYKFRHSFTGFNRLPFLPDKYIPPSESVQNREGAETTRRRCLPTIPEIVQKVVTVAQKPGGPQLTRVYVMSNAPASWLADLTKALHRAHDWTGGVYSSRDLELSWEGKHVAQAVDMHVGQRAETFIGNGFSSLTSNVVLLRMHNSDLDVSNTHFW